MQDALIKRIKAQDQTVIAQLYDDYGAALYGVVLRIVGTSEIAEQVVQDSFVKIWRFGASYDETKGRLFTWMVNIARNTAIDATRKASFRNARKTTELDSVVYGMEGDAMPHEHIGLQKVIDQLDEKYKFLIDKVYFEGYTQSEIVEETGIPLGTVKTRLRQAMKILRSQLKDNPSAVLLYGALAESFLNTF